MESEVEGDIDLNGYHGLSKDVPGGQTDLRVRFYVDAEPRYHQRVKRLSELSPVFNTIRDGAKVKIEVRPT